MLGERTEEAKSRVSEIGGVLMSRRGMRCDEGARKTSRQTFRDIESGIF